jgi:uncharacterized protein YggE
LHLTLKFDYAKTFFHCYFTILALTSFSQSKSSNEIVAEGAAKAKTTPDLAIFTLSVEKRDTIEKNALASLNKTVDQLVKSLTELGFGNENIKIANYDISSSTDDDGRKTYTTSNVLKVNFRIDHKLIDAFYNEIQQAGIQDLDVSFETILSDSLEKASRLKLVQQVIEDAKINAKNISQTLGVRIGKVKQVHKYGADAPYPEKVEMVKFTPPVIKRDTEVRYNTAFDKFQVEDVELEERITIVYEIAN